MEGMPRFLFLHPEIKQTENAFDENFLLQAKEHILMHFQADPSDYDSPLRELMDLRTQSSKATPSVESSCVLKRYYGQLKMFASRFPMGQNGVVQVPFTWYERAGDQSASHTSEDADFELSCIMYNIGSVHAAIAAEEPRDSENSIKTAFMHNQSAAWPLQQLKTSVSSFGSVSIDLDKNINDFFSQVMIAQAQECLLEKSILDSRAPAVIARLAAFLQQAYKECIKPLESAAYGAEAPFNKRFYKLWHRVCSVKTAAYGAISMLYMGMDAEADSKFGTRLGYYQVADKHVRAAIHHTSRDDDAKIWEPVQFLLEVITQKLENAKKENDFVYHERIPNLDELERSVEGLCKTKASPFDPLDTSVMGEDLFASLLPPTVLQSVSVYEEEKAKLKREIVERVGLKDDELERYLHSLDLDNMNLGVKSPSSPIEELPDMLLERNAALATQHDAIPQLLRKLQNVNELARTAETNLGDLKARLDAIDLPELTVDEGYKAISKELERLTEHHKVARSNNGELHKALAAHTSNLHLLSLPLREMSSKLIEPAPPAGTTEQGNKMNTLMQKVVYMQSQRVELMHKLADEMQRDNISRRLMSEKHLENSSAYKDELQKHEQTISIIDQNLRAQDNILSAITDANADFADYRRIHQDRSTERNEQILALVTAFDVYSDVSAKADDGTRFFEKLLNRTTKLSEAVEGIETAFFSERNKRAGERRALDEKMKALRIAREAADAMADFGIPGGPRGHYGGQLPMSSNAVGPQVSQNNRGGNRPRVGDYMEFYRSKMGGGGLPPTAGASYGVPPGSRVPPQQPQHMPYPSDQSLGIHQNATVQSDNGQQSFVLPAMPQHIYQGQSGVSPVPQQPPSPAPSSVAEYHLADASPAPSPAFQQHHSPAGMVQQHPGSQSQHQQPRYAAGPYSQQQVPQYAPAPHQTRMQPPATQRSSGYSDQSHFNPQASLPQVLPGQSTNQQLPLPQVYPGQATTHQHAPQNNSVHPGQPQYVVPPVTSYTQQPATSYQQPYLVNGNVQPSQLPYSIQPPQNPISAQQGVHPSSGIPQPSTSHMGPVQTPTPNMYQPQNFGQAGPSEISSQQTLYQSSMPQHFHAQNTNVSSAVGAVQTQGYPQPPNKQTQGYPQPPNNPHVGRDAPISRPDLSSEQPRSNVQPSPAAGFSAGPATVAQNGSSKPPAVPMNTPQPGAWGNAAQNQSFAGIAGQHGGWQQPAPPQGGIQNSPWHQGIAAPAALNGPTANFGGVPQPQHLYAPQQNSATSVVQNQTNTNGLQQQSQHLVQAKKTESNVDLLSSLLGDLQLPPAMQPVQQQGLQKSAPSQSVLPNKNVNVKVSASSSGSISTMSTQSQEHEKVSAVYNASNAYTSSSQPQHSLNVRPAAAVMPIQHRPAVATATDTPVLTMVSHSTTSFAPVEALDCNGASGINKHGIPMSLNELLDPGKFQLGEADRQKLEKRVLHESIRTQQPLPPLNQADPLNHIDPFAPLRR